MEASFSSKGFSEEKDYFYVELLEEGGGGGGQIQFRLGDSLAAQDLYYQIFARKGLLACLLSFLSFQYCKEAYPYNKNLHGVVFSLMAILILLIARG